MASQRTATVRLRRRRRSPAVQTAHQHRAEPHPERKCRTHPERRCSVVQTQTKSDSAIDPTILRSGRSSLHYGLSGQSLRRLFPAPRVEDMPTALVVPPDADGMSSPRSLRAIHGPGFGGIQPPFRSGVPTPRSPPMTSFGRASLRQPSAATAPGASTLVKGRRASCPPAIFLGASMPRSARRLIFRQSKHRFLRSNSLECKRLSHWPAAR